MLPKLKPEQTILIKTYLHESGLFYLAKSLGDRLKREGHKVIYIPKSKYLLRGSIYNRDYLKPKDEEFLKGEAVHWFDTRKPVENQVANAVIKYNADMIISFESLMEKGQWISRVKRRTKVKVVDVPMVEWVNPSLLKGKSYLVFDEIWCLTDHTKELFSDYPAAKRIKWDFVDRTIFTSVKKDAGPVRFFHAGSLNPKLSTKNTELVLKAFEKFLKEKPNVELVVSGKITDNASLRIIKKHDNISAIDEVMERNDIAKIYQASHCVIAPSSREGLGLSLYEAEACDCEIITTNLAPMNECSTNYLCEPQAIKRDQRLVPLGVLNADTIYHQIKRVYGDIICQK